MSETSSAAPVTRHPISTLGYPSWRGDKGGFDKLAGQWCDLACTTFHTPKPTISGMSYMLRQQNLNRAAREFVAPMVEKSAVPVGPHMLPYGPGFSPPGDAVLHFPVMACWTTRDGGLIVPPAWHLEEDWYLSGMVFQRAHPSGAPDRLLRHPIRDRDDVAITALGLAMHEPSVRSGTFALADDLAQSLTPLRDAFEKANRYPPNLAALWRNQSGHADSARLVQAIEYVAERARLVGWRDSEPLKPHVA